MAEAREASRDAARLRELIMGFRASQMIYVAARLGIAEQLADGPREIAALAGAGGAAAGPLYRLMRALASLGIFAETAERTFTLTEPARLLQPGVPGSLASTALIYGDEVFWAAYGAMLHSVRTGEAAFAHCHGAPMYAYLADHPDTAAVFHAAMSGFSQREIAAILAAYDFSRFSTVVDVGGGEGGLVAALLAAHPDLRGVILDRDDVAEGARRLVAETGLAGRASFTAGDFFAAVPEGGDAYLLKSVIHNWNDDDATRILRNCARAMRADARLIVLERIIPPGNAPSEAKLFDINMLVTAGGEERTEPQYRALLDASGFDLARIIPTASPLSLIEALPHAAAG